jgi:type IV secretory pathway TrbD component
MLAQKPIPRVLSRHNLILGCEREPILVSALACGGVGLASANTAGIVSCAILWLALLQALRWMGKADPQMFSIYRRSRKYRGYYPAFSRPYRDDGREMTTGHYLAAAIFIGVIIYVWERFF